MHPSPHNKDFAWQIPQRLSRRFRRFVQRVFAANAEAEKDCERGFKATEAIEPSGLIGNFLPRRNVKPSE